MHDRQDAGGRASEVIESRPGLSRFEISSDPHWCRTLSLRGCRQEFEKWVLTIGWSIGRSIGRSVRVTIQVRVVQRGIVIL